MEQTTAQLFDCILASLPLILGGGAARLRQYSRKEAHRGSPPNRNKIKKYSQSTCLIGGPKSAATICKYAKLAVSCLSLTSARFYFMLLTLCTADQSDSRNFLRIYSTLKISLLCSMHASAVPKATGLK